LKNSFGILSDHNILGLFIAGIRYVDETTNEKSFFNNLLGSRKTWYRLRSSRRMPGSNRTSIPFWRSSYFKPGSSGVMFITFDNGDGDKQGQSVHGSDRRRCHSRRESEHGVPEREHSLRTMMELLSMKAFPAEKGRCSDERIFQVAGGWITAETPQGSLFR